MPRPPAKRENYRGDAIAIHRILTAIESDERMTDADKEQLRAQLTPAIDALMKWAPKPKAKERAA